MGFYGRARESAGRIGKEAYRYARDIKGGVKDAGADLLRLANDFENSYANGSWSQAREGIDNYLNTSHSGKVLAGVPLVTAGLIAGVEPAELAINGVVAGLASPFAGSMFNRADMSELQNEEDIINRKLTNFEALINARKKADASAGGRTETSAQQIRDWEAKQKHLIDVELPHLHQRRAPIKHRQQALGLGLTGAGMALLSVLRAQGNKANEPQPSLSQRVHSSPYPATQVGNPQNVGGGVLTLNADFTQAPTLYVPPLENELMSYWGSNVVGQGY